MTSFLSKALIAGALIAGLSSNANAAAVTLDTCVNASYCIVPTSSTGSVQLSTSAQLTTNFDPHSLYADGTSHIWTGDGYHDAYKYVSPGATTKNMIVYSYADTLKVKDDGSLFVPSKPRNSTPQIQFDFTKMSALPKIVSFDWSSITTLSNIRFKLNNDSTEYYISGQALLDGIHAASGTNATSGYFTLSAAAGIKSMMIYNCNESTSMLISNVSVVPLPASLALFAPALLGLGLRRKLKK